MNQASVNCSVFLFALRVFLFLSEISLELLKQTDFAVDNNSELLLHILSLLQGQKNIM
jgi:hypothetical protein